VEGEGFYRGKGASYPSFVQVPVFTEECQCCTYGMITRVLATSRMLLGKITSSLGGGR